jgi:hypothetical protein
MINKHFVDDTLIFVNTNQKSIDSIKRYLDIVCFTSCTVVSDYKFDFLAYWA